MVTRWFNTAGPCVPEDHYMIPASARLPEIPLLVERKGYFVVPAPRQTGKTTTLDAMARELATGGHYAALLTSCESGKAWGDDVGAATRASLDQLRNDAEDALPEELWPPSWPEASEGALSGPRCGPGRRHAHGPWCCSSTRSTPSKAGR